MTRNDLPLDLTPAPSGRIRFDMNAATFSAGIVIFIVGLVLFFAGPKLVLIPSTQTQTVSLFHDESFVVSDVWERSVQLEKDVRVNGTIAVISALTGEPSEILVLVADDPNYLKWTANDNPAFVFQEELSNSQVFTLAVPKLGLYHIILDNTASPVKKKVTVNADIQKEIVISVADDRVRYVSYGVLTLGGLITMIGLVRKTQIPWA